MIYENTPENLAAAIAEYGESALWVDGAVIRVIEQQPINVPQSITRFQARAALYSAELLQAVENIMSDPETPMLAKLAWRDAAEFRRDSPTVASAAESLGLSSAQLDLLFISAAAIVA